MSPVRVWFGLVFLAMGVRHGDMELRALSRGSCAGADADDPVAGRGVLERGESHGVTGAARDHLVEDDAAERLRGGAIARRREPRQLQHEFREQPPVAL